MIKTIFLFLTIFLQFQAAPQTGEFSLFVGNVDLDNGDMSLTADVMIQVDDVIAKNLVTFKEIRKKKDHDR